MRSPIQEVIDGMTKEQKNVLYYLIDSGKLWAFDQGYAVGYLAAEDDVRRGPK